MDNEADITGSRLCEPQQRVSVKTPWFISHVLWLAELLRVTDSRSGEASVRATPNKSLASPSQPALNSDMHKRFPPICVVLRSKLDTQNARRNLGAFAWLEAILTFAVFAILALIMVPFFARGPSHNAPATGALSQIEIFATALEALHFDLGYYPQGTNGLNALVRQPPGATNWHGPYLRVVPKDPWGRDYLYDCPGKHADSGYPYEILCLGTPGYNAPIANWSIKRLKPSNPPKNPGP